MATDQNAVLPQLESFIRKRFDIAPDDPDFNNDVHLFDYGYVDSFGAQEIIAHLESSFAVKVGDDDLVKYPLNTVNEIAAFVIQHKAQNA